MDQANGSKPEARCWSQLTGWFRSLRGLQLGTVHGDGILFPRDLCDLNMLLMKTQAQTRSME